MVNPGAFRGSRKEFLLGERPSYSIAVEGGYAADALALIQRRYFKRFPIELPHSVEPSQEFLAAVDDDAPDVEIPGPDQQNMSEEEYKAAIDRLLERRNLVAYRKAVSLCLHLRSKVSDASTLANQTLAGLSAHEESGSRPQRIRFP